MTPYTYHRARLLAITTYVQIVLVGVTLVVAPAAPAPDASLDRYVLIVLLALAMGLQSATARHLGVPGLTTTVLTTMLTALAADSTLAGGKNPDVARRLLAAAAMLLSAAASAFLIYHFGICVVLALAVALLTWIAISPTDCRHHRTRGQRVPDRTSLRSRWVLLLASCFAVMGVGVTGFLAQSAGLA